MSPPREIRPKSPHPLKKNPKKGDVEMNANEEAKQEAPYALVEEERDAAGKPTGKRSGMRLRPKDPTPSKILAEQLANTSL